MTGKDDITHNFARNADRYDQYGEVQGYTACKLAEYLPAKITGPVLEAGCGTGLFTEILRKQYDKAQITAFDLSEEMISIAENKKSCKNVNFIVADAEEAEFESGYGLVASNACFHWLNNPLAAIKRFFNLLEVRSLIVFSVFGPKTYNELEKVLQLYPDVSNLIPASSFPPASEIKVIAETIGTYTKVKELVFTRTYSSLWELLITIKYTGTRGSGLDGQQLSRRKIKELEEIYLNEFGKITATLQVFFCTIQKGE